jgi:cell division protein FtsI/penicillin-binding protein 2/cell division protein FtsW (lipid II flippase)
MAVTHSRSEERATAGDLERRRAGWRGREFLLTVVASLLVAGGLYQVHQAKSEGLAEVDAGLSAKRLLNLNELGGREELLPALTPLFPNSRERDVAAREIYYLTGTLGNDGGIARTKLLSGEQFRQLKPLLVVRKPAQFQRAFYLWCGIFFGAFWAVHLFWSLRGFQGDQTFLPALMTLSGIGLILMVSLRDPVRDNLLFVDFAQGAAAGAVLLAVLSGFDYERLTGKLSFVPLVASFGLSVLLVLFGTGPGTSDAKVNLFGFQPVEIIRVLLVFFLAGYFARCWDVLRHAREKRPKLAALTSRLDIPPVEYTLPVLVSVALCLAFFFLQKDMGPALVFACLFLTLYGVARGSAFVPLAGFALLGAGFIGGYVLGVPHTVRERVSMWLSPWDNLVHGGDQLAQSLWAYSTGGIIGTGIGRGDPQMVPAGHTDLILSVLGEQWGWAGVAVVFALYAFLVYRSFRIALRARSDYEFFLAAGIGAATALQILLIAGGSLGVLPLSGVVTPFLSYGRTAMVANFAMFGILMAVEHPSLRSSEKMRPQAGVGRLKPAPPLRANDLPLVAQAVSPANYISFGAAMPFRLPLTAAGVFFALAAAAIVGKAAYIEIFRSGPTIGAGTLVVQADGGRRYQYNPRLQEIMRDIPKGTIYDRNGLPLATSNWSELEKHRADYQALGIDIDRACPRAETRHYPFGGLMFDLLGDLRTRTRWGATNTSFVERDSARRLRGYDDRPTLVEVKNPRTGKMDRVLRYDYRELVPLLRHRREPNHPEVRRVLDRPRDVRMSIDARFEVKVAEILRNQLKQAGLSKGAAVVMDPATGDLLAAVSFPLPVAGTEQDEANPYLDRARYGLYPPGSTFKVVTAMAALRKNPQLAHQTYQCVRLPDNRVGAFLKGSKRPIRDDVQDKSPHGTLDLEHGLIVSCNAYFAQLGAYEVGADALHDTATLLGIAAASPDTASELKKALAQSSYGQGEVVASPFQMARVAATVANNGAMPQGRWLADENNGRVAPPADVLPPDEAATLGRFMREVVTSGTGRRGAASVAVAGKTGTAELAEGPSHAWFIGFAPYGGAGRKIAFSVLVENGVYGGTAAAPAAAEMVNAAVKMGLIQP